MKKKRNSKKAIPKKGDPDYLSPTQLRNRRKRRAKQQKQLANDPSSSSNNNDATADGTNNSNTTNNNDNHHAKDPSMKYIANPTKAPIVRAAKNYFQSILQTNSSSSFQTTTTTTTTTTTKEFCVHLGPLYEWRTVSKLAVRPENNASSSSKRSSPPKVAIGLFLPQSHTLLPVPKCRAHHPSINRAVECVERACHEVGVIPYQENGKRANNEASAASAAASAGARDTGEDEGEIVVANSSGDGDNGVERGTGMLKYIAINVARETGAVQITLVWNTPPPATTTSSSLSVESENGITKEGIGSKRKHDGGGDGGGGRMGDPVLEKLVKKLISMSGNDNVDSNPSATGDEKDDSAKAGEDASSKLMYEPSEPKKKRRRGRREGKPTTNNDGSNKNDVQTPLSNAASKSNRRSHHPPPSKKRLNLHSLWINYNPSWKHSNAIFSFDSSCWHHVHGPRAIIEHLTFSNNKNTGYKSKSNDVNGGGGVSPLLLANPTPLDFPIPLNFPPNVFRQANLDAFQNIIGRIRERVQSLREEEDGEDDKRKKNNLACLELYGGVGTIGLHVSDMVTSLVSSDENPNNLECFDESVRELPAHIRSRLVYRKKNAADMVASEGALFRKSRVLIVDPPRKGLDVEVVDYLCREGYKTMSLVVYVSCGFAAFQRDCDALRKSGRWKVEFAEGYLLFPGSDAIETLAFFVPA